MALEPHKHMILHLSIFPSLYMLRILAISKP